MEEALASLREELSDRGRLLQAAKKAEQAARDELSYERQRANGASSATSQAALREADLLASKQRAERAEQELMERVTSVEAELRRAKAEQGLMKESIATAEAETTVERNLGRERAVKGGKAAENERAAQERAAAAEAARDAEVAAAKREALDAHKALEATKARELRRCGDLEAELRRVRDDLERRLSQSEGARSELLAAHEDLQRRFEELQKHTQRLEAKQDSQRLQSSRLATAVARAQEAEGERARMEEALRRQLDEAQLAAEQAQRECQAARAHADVAEEQAREAQRQLERTPSPQEQMASVRELLSAVKIAVLAPCLKLHINGADPLHVGSAGQGDFTHLSSMLEENVLKRFSQVTLLDSDTPLATGTGGAHAIFPELKETMACVQGEVKERLVAMMQTAGAGEG